MIGALLDRLQSLVGKGYLFAGLFPLLAAVLFSIPLVWAVESAAPYWLQEFLAIPAQRQAVYVGVLIFLVSFVAYLLWLMNSALRALLESTALPTNRRRLIGEYLDLEEKLRRLRPMVVRLRIGERRWAPRIGEARQNAAKLGRLGRMITKDTLACYLEICQARAAGQEVTSDQVHTLYGHLVRELNFNSAERVDKLREICDEFRHLVRYSLGHAEAELNRLTEIKLTRFPANEGMIRSTELANSALANGDRIYQQYGMNIDLFWPLLEKFARADEKMSAGLEETKLRLDFSVGITAMAAAYTIAWVPALLVFHAEWWIFLTVASLGPLITRAAYRMSVRSSYSLYASMGATAELYRFDLLKALHCRLPADTDEERALWNDLTALGELNQGSVTYQHPP